VFDLFWARMKKSFLGEIICSYDEKLGLKESFLGSKKYFLRMNKFFP
jgi:hypothetical protein